MDFFENQQRARRSSALLVFLYILAVLGIVAAVNLVLRFAYRWNAPQAEVPLQVYVFGTLASSPARRSPPRAAKPWPS